MPLKEDEKPDTLNPAEKDYQQKVDREFGDITSPKHYGQDAEEPQKSSPALQDAEKKAESTGGSPIASGAESSFYKAAGGAGAYSAQMLLKNRKVMGGALGGFILILIVAVFAITSLGPLKYIQFAKMLQAFHFSDQELISSTRLRNFYIYSQIARSGNGNLENTRLGTIEAVKAKKIDKQLKSSGLTSDFNGRGTFTGFTFNADDLADDNPLKQQLDDIDENDIERRQSTVARYFSIDSSALSGNGKVMKISVEGTKNNRRLFAKALSASPDYNVMTASFAKRILIKRANLTYNPITRVKEGTKQSIAERYNEWKEQRKARLSGDTSLNNLNKPGNIDATNEDGTKPDGLDDINNANNGASDVIDNAKAKVKLTKIAGGGAALAVLSALCTVRDVGDVAAKEQTLNKIGPMMQAASETLAIGSKIQAGDDISLETIGEFNKSLDSEDGGSWSSASSIQYELGEDPTYSTLEEYPELRPNETTAVTAVDDIFKAIDDEVGLGFAVDVVCGAFDVFSAITAPLVSALTGGLSELLSDKISELLIGFLAGEPVDLTDPKYAGEVFGEATNIGGRLMANEASASQGGRPLNNIETAQLKSETQKYIATTDERNALAVAFDLTEPTNPLAQLAVGISSKNYNVIAKRLTNIDAIAGRAYAAETISENEAYYSVPKFGFNIEKLEKEDYADPYKNANWVATNLTPDSPEVELFEECNNIDVTDNWDFVSLSYPAGIITDYNELPEDCLNDDNEAMYRLRVLALDTITIKSFSCLEYDDSQACSEIYPDNVGNTSTQPTSPNAPSKDGWVWPLANDLRQGPCWNRQGSDGTYHAGLDINTNDVSNTNPALAAHDGKVVKTGNDPDDAGNYIIIQSTDGVYYSYQHLNSISVSIGDIVTAGQPVGIIGKTGNVNATSAGHLHFVTAPTQTLGAYSSAPQTNTVDPLTYLPSPAPNGYECIK